MTVVQIADDAPQVEYDHLFLRWRVQPAAVRQVRRHGDAVVVELVRDRHGDPVAAPHLMCLGPAHDLGPLLRETGGQMTQVPEHVTVEQHGADLLPPHWRWEHRWRWEWMWTTEAPPARDGEDSVVELPLDAEGVAEIEALLEVANPGSHGRPADDGEQRWFGVRDASGRLVAAGGRFLLPSGVSHLRGISTRTEMRGRGLGSALSARLTRIGLEDGGGICTLGAYSENTPALEIYRRLGFRLGHSFCSGALVR